MTYQGAEQPARPPRVQQLVAHGLGSWQPRRLPRRAALPARPSRLNGHHIKLNGRAALDRPFTPLDFTHLQVDDLDVDSGQNGHPIDPDAPGILAPLPRRSFLRAVNNGVKPPQMRFVSFPTRRRVVLGRFFRWATLFITFLLAMLWDRLRRQDSLEHRAERIRNEFERAGGSILKVGLHMALRFDLLPWTLSVELSQMQDRVEPFPLEMAQPIIEQATGKPMAETFQTFDPQPILATSMQNIYQARLANGSRVVVKVRRPGAGEQFMADLKVIDWLLGAFEWLTVLRPGYTEKTRRELRQIVLEELNFTQEIRYQELFRRAAKRSGKDFFTSPRIHFDLSGEEVVVEEFVGGLWLSELLSAVQAGDEALLERARAEDIDLSKVARQLLWVNSWGWSENLFFYTNPQPDNIIVAPGSKLIFTEFSSVSAIDRSMRRALRRNMQSLADNDALNMARASLILLEPLPPISLSEFIKELEGRNWQMLYALANRNDYSDWVDLTTAAQWKGLVEVCAKYGVVIDLNVLRLLRSMMLFESMAVRLDRKLDVVKEYRQFDDFRAFQSRQRIISMVEKQVRKGGTDRNYLVLDRVTSTGDRIFQRIRQVAATPAVSFSTMMSKWSFAFFMLIKFLYQVLLVSVVALGVAFSIQLIAGDGRLNLIAAVQMVVTDRVYLLIVLFLLFVNGRSVLFRMDDTEV